MAGRAGRAGQARPGASSAREKPRGSCGSGPGGRAAALPPPQIAQLAPWSPGPATEKGSGLRSGWRGPGQRGPRRPRTEGAQGGGSRPAPPALAGPACTRLLPCNGERNLQPPLKCCKTNPGTLAGLARRWRRAAPRAPPGPHPRQQPMGGPGRARAERALGRR